ncbi:hypothetical protein [Spirillospora sp. NPDC029432]|uniref:DUF7455 domain-containing protein n=1 Tax=Spirillospora sp. NPDC029432 TaxID=3154599 RepID=UPI003454F839
MKTRLFRISVPPAGDPAGAGVQPSAAGILWSAGLANAGHSCCCPARPVVAAVIHPANGRPADLLFCRHHFIASRPALEAAHATVYDARGDLVTTGDVRVP